MNIRQRSRHRSTFCKLFFVFLFLSILLLESPGENSIHFGTSERDFNYFEKSVTLEADQERDKTNSKATVEKLLINHTAYSEVKTTERVTTPSTRMHVTKKDTTNSNISPLNNRYDVKKLSGLKTDEGKHNVFDRNKTGDNIGRHIEEEEITTIDTILRNSDTISTTQKIIEISESTDKNATTENGHDNIDEHFYTDNETSKDEDDIPKHGHHNVNKKHGFEKKDNGNIKNNNNYKTKQTARNRDENTKIDTDNSKSDSDYDKRHIPKTHGDVIKTGNDIKKNAGYISETGSGVEKINNDIDMTSINIANTSNGIAKAGNSFDATGNDIDYTDRDISQTDSGITTNVAGNSKNYTIEEKNDNDIVKMVDSTTKKKIYFKTKHNDYTNTDISNITNDISINDNNNTGKKNDFGKPVIENATQTGGSENNRNYSPNTRKKDAKKVKENISQNANLDNSKRNDIKDKEPKLAKDESERHKDNKKIHRKTVGREKGKEHKIPKISKSQKRFKNKRGDDKSDISAKTVPNNKRYIQDDAKHRKSKVSTTYGKDKGSNYVKSRYITHKFLHDNGPKLSAKERAKLVNERCKSFMHENKMKLSKKPMLRFDDESFLLSRKYNLMVCFNSKVASNNLKRVSYALDNNLEDINDIRRHEARVYSQTRMRGIKQLTSRKKRTSFMLVREPLERLVSAYRDERAFPQNNKDTSITFRNFLQQILHGNTNHINRHMYPYFERCRPCEIKYDYIGLVHNFAFDVKKVLVKIGADRKVGIPERKKTGYHSVTSDKLVKQYFSKIPNYMIHQLWVKYYKDYYIFGFPYPKHLMK